ncbi:hypothetical protein MTR_3g040830 [Medicago truncatula]|uniref:Uncharacterized protein n=1 Tax=Medicago truncatula TaxID=3880 RepID=A0A072UUJ9_MEDTR|nr:hypothetical protein MTR_3g040830 [Medicago truncatula]
MVNVWDGTLKTITAILPNNFECPCSESLICRCFKSKVVMHFKFNQAWTLAELLLSGLRPPQEAQFSCYKLEGRRGAAPVEMCTKARYQSKANGSTSSYFDGYDAPVCDRSHREPLHFLLLQLQIQGTQSWKRVHVFNIMARCPLMEGTGEEPEEAFWSRQGSSRAKWEVASHMSLGLGQTASLEPVVEVVVDVGVRALARTAADFCEATSEATRVRVGFGRGQSGHLRWIDL